MPSLKRIRENSRLQLLIGFSIGILFGFLLQKGGVTYYEIIISQLLLESFIVLKVMFTAIIVGMIGVYSLRYFGLVDLHPKSTHLSTVIVGGLIFGVGFALLGYCPGTSVGGIGMGSLHALVGALGIILGASIYANSYPRIRDNLEKWSLGDTTIPEFFNVNPWIIILILVTFLTALMYYIESAGY